MIDRPQLIGTNGVAWRREMDAGTESGGSEPHLFECSGGELYMVKAPNNPQQGRVLCNEAVGALCLDWLGVLHPPGAVINLAPELLAASPGAKFKNGQPLAAGLAFGSSYWPSDPSGTIALDLVANPRDVAATLVFDTWITNGDGRQYRVRKAPTDPKVHEYFPVDQGHLIAHDWTGADLVTRIANVAVVAALMPLSPGEVRSYADRLGAFDVASANHILAEVPSAWLPIADRSPLATYLVARAGSAKAALYQQYSL